MILLEGRSRLGGRTYTSDIAGVPVDLGASWVHGKSGSNPVVQCLSRLGIEIKADIGPGGAWQAGSGRLEEALYESSGSAIGAFIFELPALRAKLGAEASVAQGVDAFLAASHPEPFDPKIARGLLRSVFEDWYGGALEDQSLEHVWTDEEYPGGDGFPVGGYRGLVDGLADQLDVRLDHPVQVVEHDSAGVRVHAGDEVFEGSQAIVTVPLGVLQAGAIEFRPSLPEPKRRAIDVLGMGHYEKVVQRLEEDCGAELEQVVAFSTDDEPTFAFLKNMSSLAGAPTWIAFAAGQFAVDLHKREASAVYSQSRAILKSLCGRELAPPVAQQHTDWAVDPHSLGSYSFVKTGSAPSDRTELAKPIGRLQFAGEATERDYFGTVHGALQSGLREAGRVLGRLVGVDELF